MLCLITFSAQVGLTKNLTFPCCHRPFGGNKRISDIVPFAGSTWIIQWKWLGIIT